MTMRYSAAAAGFLVLGSLAASDVQPAAAADAKGAFALHGVGALTCKDVTGALLKGDTSIRTTLASWMLGYVSAMNRIDAGTYDVTPVQIPDALVNMVVGICQKDADARVETITYAVFHAFDPAKTTAESPEIQVTANGQVTTLRKDSLMAVQRYLVAQKLLHGNADGTFGSETEAALHTFQQKQNLPNTGLPDPATVVRILIELPMQKTTTNRKTETNQKAGTKK